MSQDRHSRFQGMLQDEHSHFQGRSPDGNWPWAKKWSPELVISHMIPLHVFSGVFTKLSSDQVQTVFGLRPDWGWTEIELNWNRSENKGLGQLGLMTVFPWQLPKLHIKRQIKPRFSGPLIPGAFHQVAAWLNTSGSKCICENAPNKAEAQKANLHGSLNRALGTPQCFIFNILFY